MAFKVILLTGLAVSLIPLLYAAKKHKPKPPPPQPPPAWCYVCEDDLLPERMRCTHVRPRHLQQCPPGVYQCYIQVNSVLSFRRGCAYPNNTIYQECVARQMDKCIVCEFDKCNSFSIVNELSNFYCIQKVGKTIINAPCSDSVNLLTLPNSCLAQYNAEGLALTKCVTEKLLPNYIPSYSTFEYECTGYDCQWMNSEMSCLVDNPEPGKQPCIAYKKSTIVGCYKIDDKRGCNTELTGQEFINIARSPRSKGFVCFLNMCNVKDRARCYNHELCRTLDARCFLRYESTAPDTKIFVGCEENLPQQLATSPLTFYCRNEGKQRNCNDYTKFKYKIFGCYVCDGYNCQIIENDPKARFMCKNGETSCYSVVFKNGMIRRGCGNACLNTMGRFRCKICNYVYCNNEPIYENTLTCPMSAIHLDRFSSFPRIRFAPCPSLVVQGAWDKCGVAKDSVTGYLEYNCMYSTKKCINDNFQCRFEKNALELRNDFMCFRCRSDRPDETNCARNLKGFAPQICDFKYYPPFEACFTRFNTEYNAVERGCLSELYGTQIDICMNPSIDICVVCVTNGCNRRIFEIK